MIYKRQMKVVPFFFAMYFFFLHFVSTMELPDLGDSSGSLISPVKERQLSKAVLGELRKSGAPFIEDEIILRYLNNLLDLKGDLIISKKMRSSFVKFCFENCKK